MKRRFSAARHLFISVCRCLDIYTTLAAGAELQILPKQLFAFPVRLLEYMNSRKVNTIYWVPTALSIVANWKVLDYVSLPYMEKVLFAGEVMPVKQLNYWRRKMPELLYANLYGPTEVTDICAYYHCGPGFLRIVKHCLLGVPATTVT